MNIPAANSAFYLVAFVLFWFGGAAVMSRMAGWHALSARYPAPVRFTGQEFRFCTAALGSGSFPLTYRRCVRVALNDDGIGLRLMFPFRFYSPPFFVPWTSVVACTEKQVLLMNKVTLSFADTDRQVTFGGRMAQVVKAVYQGVQEGREAGPRKKK